MTVIQFGLIPTLALVAAIVLGRVLHGPGYATSRALAILATVAATLIGLTACTANDRFAARSSEVTATQDETHIVARFFYSSACVSCNFTVASREEAEQARLSNEARSKLDNLAGRYPQLEVESFEVTYHPENRLYLESMAKSAGAPDASVPMVFIGTRYWTVYGPESAQEIQAYIETLLGSR